MKHLNSLILMVLFAVCGCSEDNDANRRSENVQKEDVIVQVNDHVLTRQDVLRYFKQAEAKIGTMPATKHRDAFNRLREDIMEYIPSYIEKKLLMDDALRIGVMTTQDLDDRVEAVLKSAAKNKSLSLDAYLRSLGGDAAVLKESVKTRILINAYAANQFQDCMNPSPLVVSNYVDLIQSEKQAAISTNEAIQVELARLRSDFEAGKVDFGKYAEEHSDEPYDQGEMQRGDFVGESELAEEVFAIKKHGISRTIEEPDHFYILYINDVIPAELDKDGKVEMPERRHIFKLVKNKADLPVEMTFEMATEELKRQFTMSAMNERVETLKTNGVHKIVWPNGKKTWKDIFVSGQSK